MIVKLLKGKNSKQFGERNLTNAIAHIKYVGFRSREAGDKKGFFSEKSENADYKAFIKRIEDNKALQHSNTVKIQKIVIALQKEEYDIYKHSGKDLKDIVRETMKQYEKEHNVKLDWVANIHHENEKNPHAHIIIKGVTDNAGDRGASQRVKLNTSDAKEMRQMAQDHIDKYFDKDYAKEYWKEFFKNNPDKSTFKNNFEKKDVNYFKSRKFEGDIAKTGENILKKIAFDIEKETSKAEYQSQRDNENKFQRKPQIKDEINRINKKERER